MKRGRAQMALLVGVLAQLVSGEARAQPVVTLNAKPAVDAVVPANAMDAADSLLSGTLFFSDHDRRQLDQLRNRPKKTAIQTASEPEVDESRSVINGYIRRGDGRVTVWVDGVPIEQPAKSLAEKIGAASVGNSLADVRISVIDSVKPAPVALKPPVARVVRKKAATKSRAK